MKTPISTVFKGGAAKMVAYRQKIYPAINERFKRERFKY